MTVTREQAIPWLLLVFSLPARSASQRVQIWRKLQRYGMLALRSSGHVLPNTAANQERMEWLATAIRTYKGQASVVHVQGFDDLPSEHLKLLFVEARSRDYQKLLHEVKRVLALSPSRRPGGRLNRIRRRFLELQDIDFFGSPLRAKVENLFAQADTQRNISHARIRGPSPFVAGEIRDVFSSERCHVSAASKLLWLMTATASERTEVRESSGRQPSSVLREPIRRQVHLFFQAATACCRVAQGGIEP